jgi:hypothetical protein
LYPQLVYLLTLVLMPAFAIRWRMWAASFLWVSVMVAGFMVF